jgi:hypothetical protein
LIKIDDIWDRLQTQGDFSSGYVRLRIPTVTVCALYASKNVHSGALALVLEVATISLPGNMDLPRSTGFVVSATTLTPGRGGRTRLILDLLDSRYGDVFRSLCADLTDRLAAVADEPAAVRLFVSRLVRWQSFLRDHGPEGLSLQARRGLAGELCFLRDELLPRMGEVGAETWRGWSRANHDFQLPASSIEVKTTVANTPHSFHVSNVGQLDETSTPALHLCLTAINESENSGETLPEIVESVRKVLGTQASNEFDDRLLQTGLIPAHFDLYSSPRYTIRWRHLYRVLEGFPRLLGSSLPPGVEDVEYAVAVAACAPFVTELASTLDGITRSTAGTE